MTSSQLRRACADLGLTYSALGRIMGLDRHTMARICRGDDRQPTKQQAAFIRALRLLHSYPLAWSTLLAEIEEVKP